MKMRNKVLCYSFPILLHISCAKEETKAPAPPPQTPAQDALSESLKKLNQENRRKLQENADKLRELEAQKAELERRWQNQNSGDPARGTPAQTYKTLDGGTVLTLISKEECELTEHGTILLCKYTRPDSKTLRLIVNALGTSQVIYFRLTEQGLEDAKGNILFTPDQLSATREQRKREADRLAQREQDSIRETRIIATKTLCQNDESQSSEDKLTVTDVSLKLQYPPDQVRTYLFKNITDIYDVKSDKWGNRATGFYENYFAFIVQPNNIRFLTVACRTEAEARSLRDTVVSAFNDWKEKFPEAVAWKSR